MRVHTFETGLFLKVNNTNFDISEIRKGKNVYYLSIL